MVKTIKSIIFLVENKTRDLDSILFFSEIILKKDSNLKIHILPISKLNFKNLYKKEKSIIVWPHPRHFLINWSYFLGHINVIHESEGIPYKKEQLFHSSNYLHNFAINQVWCWGINQQKILQKRFKNSFLSNKIINTGSIRYEYAKNKLKKYPPIFNKPKALITTNYNILNPKYQTLYKEMMDHKDNYKLETSDPNKFLNWMISEAERRLSFLYKIKNESETICKFNVELRPHPYEDKGYYTEKIIAPIEFKLQNFNEDISEAISKSHIIIATGCQTVLDSIINGKPVFGDSTANYNIWDKYIIPIENLSNYDLDNKTFKKLAKKQLKNAISNGLEKWLSNIIYQFDYSQLMILLNCKYKNRFIQKNIIFIIFYIIKSTKLIIFLKNKISYKSSSEKSKKRFSLDDIIDSKKRICPNIKYVKNNDHITLLI